jgi:DNA/RNA endonuclease YhcR with UshA esterase domain
MEERHLIGISFLISTAGVLLLYYISLNSTPIHASIADLTYDDIGERVLIEGQIISKRVHKDGHIFLKVADASGKIDVIIFSSQASKLGDKIKCLSKKNKIEVAGEIEDYKGTLELILRNTDDLRC